MRKLSPTIKRGRLSPEEESVIEEMAARLASRKGIAGIIASKLNRHPSTVHWCLYRLGLRTPSRRVFDYQRKGHRVVSFSEREDALITKLRTQGLTKSEISRCVTASFDHPRSPHTIGTRLIMLANQEETTS